MIAIDISRDDDPSADRQARVGDTQIERIR